MGNKDSSFIEDGKDGKDDIGDDEEEFQEFKINKRPKDDISDKEEQIDEEDEWEFGWIKDETDERDHIRKFDSFLVVDNEDNDDIKKDLDTKIDLTENVEIGIYNQGKLNSCSATALAFLFEYKQEIEKNINKVTPSRLFLWYNGRRDNMKDKNVGASIRTILKTMTKTKYGVCSEDIWPYNWKQFSIKPSQESYKLAKDNIVIKYAHVGSDINPLKGALSAGYPVCFGFWIFPSSFKGQRGGNVIVPTEDELNKYIKQKKTAGGHAVVIVGFDDEKKVFKIRNSWGDKHGDKGYYYFPYQFMTHTFPCYMNGKVIQNVPLCGDFWIIEQIEIM